MNARNLAQANGLKDPAWQRVLHKSGPALDDRREVSLRELIKDFAGFATSFLDWQLEYLRRLRGGHPGCQILRANMHVRPPELRKRGLVQIMPILGVRA